MITLVPLCTMALVLGKAVDAGNTPAGQRMAAEITSGSWSDRQGVRGLGAADGECRRLC
jgi:hypothetical protein